MAKGEWPLPARDNRLSARSDVPCDMRTAPEEVWSYDLGRLPTRWAMAADLDDDGRQEVLYGPSPLVCVDPDGRERWRCACGGVVAVADLDGDGDTEVIVDGPQILSGKTGRVLWSRNGAGGVGRHRIHVEKLLPDVRGLQIACVSEKHEYNQAQVWSFSDGCEKARLVWEREFHRGTNYSHCTSAAGRFDERTMCVAAAVEGGLIAMDARDGSDLFRFFWSAHPGEGGVRNYGALAIRDLDGDGKAEFVILNDLIYVQVGVFAPARGGIGGASDAQRLYPGPEVAHGDLAAYPEGPILWRRYFEAWYPQGVFTLHVPATPLADVDGDGRPEIVVSLHRDRWELKVYDALTGHEKLSAPDLYVHSLMDLDDDGVSEIIAAQEPARTPREFTTLVIGNLQAGAWRERWRRDRCRLEHTSAPILPPDLAGRNLDPRVPVILNEPSGRSLILTEDTDGDGRADRLLRLTVRPGAIQPSGIAVDRDARVLAATERLLVTTGSDAAMRLLAPDGQETASWPCGHPAVAGAAVADLDGDGRNEIVLCRADRRVVALGGPFSGTPPVRELWRADGLGIPAPFACGPVPLLADVDGDGRKETLTASGAGVQLLDSLGRTIWRTILPGAVDTPLYGAITRATFGDFDGDGRLDAYVSVRMAATGNDACHSFALDGRSGKILWHNDAADPVIWHHTLGPTGLPAVADVDGDGLDDILFVTLDLCTELSGRDGGFLHTPLIANGIWRQADRSTQWTAYGTQIPVDLDGDGKLEVLLGASWGQWGAWTMDRKLIWTMDPGREEHARRHPGIADADGDGKLELGILHDGGFFRCRDAATGALKWELSGIRQNSDVVAADVDGDGRPEFLAGGPALAAIKALNGRSGKMLWEVPVPGGARSPAVADVDGDGLGEIVVGCGDGNIRVYK